MTSIHSPSIKQLVSSTLLSATLGCISFSADAAGPGTVANQTDNVSISSSGTTTTIRNSGSHAIINWNEFNVAAGDTVIFDQSPVATTLNRVSASGGLSQIDGTLNSNGRVFILNPNGVIFGSGAKVNVGSLLASSLNMTDDDFKADNHQLTAVDGTYGHVANHGSIHAASAGFVALVGETVANTGTIRANLGAVTLAAGRTATISFDGGLTSFHTNNTTNTNNTNNTNNQDGSIIDVISNSGAIYADGGQVYIKANVASDVFTNAVNNTGIIHATHINEKKGIIFITANNGDINLAGKVSNFADTEENPDTILIHAITNGNVHVNTDITVNSQLTVGSKNSVSIAENATLTATGENKHDFAVINIRAKTINLLGQIEFNVYGSISLTSFFSKNPLHLGDGGGISNFVLSNELFEHINMPEGHIQIGIHPRTAPPLTSDGSWNIEYFGNARDLGYIPIGESGKISIGILFGPFIYTVVDSPALTSLNERATQMRAKNTLSLQAQATRALQIDTPIHNIKNDSTSNNHHDISMVHRTAHYARSHALNANATTTASTLLPSNSESISLQIIPQQMLLPAAEL